MTKIFFKGRNYSVPFTISCEKNTYAVDTTDRLGHGGNGVVYPCYRKGTGEEFAIKFIYLGEKGKERGKISLRSKNETCCLRELHHDHVIKYVADGILDAQDGRSNKYVFRYIIMDRAEGTLLNKHKQISTQLPSVIIGHIISVVSALEYIHRQGLIHRDIKPENILISGTKWVISDFGLAKHLSESKEITDIEENIGPKNWLSPEANNKRLGLQENIIDESSDVFQLCAVLWYLINGRHPSGILQVSDWKTDRLELFRPILIKGLQHDKKKRYKDGLELCKAIKNSLEN